MRLECGPLKYKPAVFFWDQPCDDPKKASATGRSKMFAMLSTGEQFDVPDDVGHEILTKYKGQFKVVGYGNEAKGTPRKSIVAPKTTMIKEEKIK